MRNRTHKTIRAALPRPRPAETSETHLQETIRLSRETYAASPDMKTISIPDFLLRQARFIAPPIWLFQGAVLLAICVVIQIILTDQAATAHASTFLTLSAALIALTGLPFLLRSWKHRVAEVEMTTRISLAQLTLARFAVIGIGEAVALAAMLLLSYGRAGLTAGSALAHVIFPFLVSSLWSLGALSHMKGRAGIIASASGSIVLAILLCAMPFATSIGAFLCIPCAVLLLWACYRFAKQTLRIDFAPMAAQ